MHDIQPLQAHDLSAVAALVRSRLADSPGRDVAGLAAFMGAVLLDHPWADPALPSWVARTDGRLTGFIAVHPRRVLLGERPVRAAVCSHLVVAADAPGGALGALLLGRALAGPQELTFSDTANALVRRLWEAMGGRTDALRSCEWMIVLRPLAWGLALVRRRLSRRSARHATRPAAVRAVPFGALRPARHGAHDAVTQAVDAPAAARHLDALLRGPGVRTVVDSEHLVWLLAQVAGRSGGALRTCIVWRGRRVAGWFVSVHHSGGVVRVLQVVASRRDAEAVFGALVQDARRARATVLTGRADPELLEALRGHGAILAPGDRHVLHARDREVLTAIGRDGSRLSRLDGEWW